MTSHLHYLERLRAASSPRLSLVTMSLEVDDDMPRGVAATPQGTVAAAVVVAVAAAAVAAAV